jgi:hypothetical protein
MIKRTKRKRTSRGFTIYAEIPDSHGNTLRVQESSATGDERSPGWLWLFVDESSERQADREEWERRMGRRAIPAPHLSLDQVRALRAALDAFLIDYEAR